MTEATIQDATGAQAATRRHLDAQYGADKIRAVKFSRSWYTAGTKMDLWEVEGDVTIQTGVFSKVQKHFKAQVHPDNGRVIAFDG